MKEAAASLQKPALSLCSSPFKTTFLHRSKLLNLDQLSTLSLSLPPKNQYPKMSAAGFLSAPAVGGYTGLRAADPNKEIFPAKSSVGWRARTVSNGSRTHCMKVWNPINNKKFETLSYLPPLTPESIARQVEYMMTKGWVPCLEFDEAGKVHRTNSQMPGYYDGRYWTLWKLPMFGCTDAAQVLNEIEECKKAYPDAYIRLLSFDNKHQCQCMAFVIQKPADA